MSKIAIGIDIGTSKSVVGVYLQGKVEIVSQGDYTPSYVAFTNTGRLIGEETKKLAANNVSNTLYGTKRLIGRMFNDTSVQSDMKHWPFKVVLGEGGRPKVNVLVKGEETGYFAEDISGMLVKTMKETAEEFLGGQTVTNAVVTVPAALRESRRCRSCSPTSSARNRTKASTRTRRWPLGRLFARAAAAVACQLARRKRRWIALATRNRNEREKKTNK